MFLKWFCWSLDMVSFPLCVRSHILNVPQIQKSWGWRGAWQAEPWWFLLFQLPHQGSTASLHTGWIFLRKIVKPHSGEVFFFFWGKGGTRRPVQLDVGQVFCRSDLTAFSRSQQHCVNVVIWENVQSSDFQGGFFRYPDSLGVSFKKHSAWWTGIEPALLCTAGVIWVRINLVWRNTKRKNRWLFKRMDHLWNIIN